MSFPLVWGLWSTMSSDSHRSNFPPWLNLHTSLSYELSCVWWGMTCERRLSYSCQIHIVSLRMDSLMFTEYWLCGTAFPTFTIFRGFLSCTSSLVSNETWLLKARFSTATAYIRSISGVKSLTCTKLRLPGESFLTLTASMGLHSSFSSLLSHTILRHI